MSGRVSAGRQFVVATAVAYSGYPPKPCSDSRSNSGLRKIRRKVSLDFAKVRLNTTENCLAQLKFAGDAAVTPVLRCPLGRRREFGA
jgi:hypothetical protein